MNPYEPPATEASAANRDQRGLRVWIPAVIGIVASLVIVALLHVFVARSAAFASAVLLAGLGYGSRLSGNRPDPNEYR